MRRAGGADRRSHPDADARLDGHRRPQLVRRLSSRWPPTSTSSASTTGATAAASGRGAGSAWRTAPTTPSPWPTCWASTGSSRSATRWAARSPSSPGGATPSGSKVSCCAPPAGTSGPADRVSGPCWAAIGVASVAARAVPRRVHRSMGERLLNLRYDESDLGRWARQQVVRNDTRMVVEAGQALGNFSSRDWIGSVDVPCAVVVTEADTVVPPYRQHRLADAIPGATVHSVVGRPRRVRHGPRGLRPGAGRRLPRRGRAGPGAEAPGRLTSGPSGRDRGGLDHAHRAAQHLFQQVLALGRGVELEGEIGARRAARPR